MELHEFRIGREFYMADRRWRCTDVGSRVVVAIRVDEVTITRFDAMTKAKTDRIISGEEAQRLGYLNGPPYGMLESVFDEYDLENCTLMPNSDSY